jgi:hypothetical protein
VQRFSETSDSDPTPEWTDDSSEEGDTEVNGTEEGLLSSSESPRTKSIQEFRFVTVNGLA